MMKPMNPTSFSVLNLKLNQFYVYLNLISFRVIMISILLSCSVVT